LGGLAVLIGKFVSCDKPIYTPTFFSWFAFTMPKACSPSKTVPEAVATRIVSAFYATT
jgi:hypothetical protein